MIIGHLTTEITSCVQNISYELKRSFNYGICGLNKERRKTLKTERKKERKTHKSFLRQCFIENNDD